MPSTFIGDTEIDWEFVVDPQVVAQQVFAAADELANTRRPMEIARDVLISDMEQKFQAETGAFGKWEDWAPGYTNHGPSILTRTGKMRRTSKQKNSWVVNRDTLFFDTSRGPKTEEGYPIGLLHETGTISKRRKALEARIARGLSTSEVNQVFDELSGHLGRGKNLPPRPWIEPTDKAKDSVEAVFVAWLEGGIRTATGKFIPGVVRGAGGRFVSMRR